MAGGADPSFEGGRARYRVRAQGRSALLGEGEVVIGRSPYCSLVLDHETLSRLHASFRLVEDGVELSDLGSSNGTFVNGVRLAAPALVGPDDEIRLGALRVFLDLASDPLTGVTGQLAAVRAGTTGADTLVAPKDGQGT
jgi:pSer/pThr/pTyr-binding forkhead associated (FHA) protein